MSERVTTEFARMFIEQGGDRGLMGDAFIDLLDARRERDEAREIAGCLRWERREDLYRLEAGSVWLCSVGNLSSGWFSVWVVDGKNADSYRHKSAHEAARAVCDAIGLPFITAGLPGEERDDG